jgi:uncharacterized membrane protein YeiH
MTGPTKDPTALRRAELRRATLRLVLGVVALDAVALGVYSLAGIGHAAERTRTIFVVTWTVTTAVVVAVLLKRVRAARFMAPRRG